MFIFGHLGIGLKLASPFSRDLRSRDVLLGTILPDLLDKPLYYGLEFATGKRGADLGIIAGTRSFGHTAIFLLVLGVTSFAARSKRLAAIAIGVATHLVLDAISDRLIDSSNSSINVGQYLLWPAYGWQFPIYPFQGLSSHLAHGLNPVILYGEIIGVAILAWEYWKTRYRKDFTRRVGNQHTIRNFKNK